MSSRFWEEPPRWVERCRDWALFVWFAAVAAWRRNPGYAVATLSGTLGLLLAIWLLLSSFFSWLIAPPAQEVLSSSPTASTDLSARSHRFEIPPDDEPVAEVEQDFPPEVAAKAIVRSPQILGAPLEPEFADVMPQPIVPPGRLLPVVVEAAVDDESLDEEPATVSRFTRANPVSESRFEDDDPVAPIEDDPSPMVADEIEQPAEPDLRLTYEPLTPEFADSRALAWLMPEPEIDQPSVESVEVPAEPEVAQAEAEPETNPEGWKGAAPLTQQPPPAHSEQSEPLATRVVPPEAPPAVVEVKPTPQPPPVRTRSPKLALRWGPQDVAQTGRIHTMTLFVSNIGDAPAVDVHLELQLPGGIGHPEGRNLEQTLRRLAPGEVERIPLIIRPEAPGEVRLPVSARAGKVSARSTGVLKVDDAPRGSIADRGCDTDAGEP